MEIFAHGGVDHTTATEAAAHSTTPTLVTVILVSFAIALLAGGTVYLVNRFAFKKAQSEDEEEK